jgi:TnpA family transposase
LEERLPRIPIAGAESRCDKADRSYTYENYVVRARWNRPLRVDPRRHTFTVGTYAHVLNQWGICYDQPIVLNKRQAGAAIEGALRQRFGRLDRVAVDTHGFTHAATGLAKLVGLDLCPRLADLADRGLHLPRGFDVLTGIEVLADRSVSLRLVQRGWDPLVRIADSADGG